MNFLSEMAFKHCFIFGVIISAVDPVAVLSVFDAVNADRDLYYLVFGEALFNDGVTFVLFEGVKEIAKLDGSINVPAETYFYVVLTFFISPATGALIGLLSGLFSALITKITSNETAYFQPIFIVCVSLFAYFFSKALGFSGIIGLIVCGLVQMRYAMPNLSPLNQITTKNIVESVANLCEILIFVMLGSQTSGIRLDKVWIFLLVVIVAITIWRLVITFSLVFIINIFRYKSVSWKWQTIMFFGGLRGAFAFVMSLEYDGPFNLMFLDTTLLIIAITNILNGIATKPLVSCMKLQDRNEVKEKTFLNLSKYATNQTALGLKNLFSSETQQNLLMKIEQFEREYVFRYLCRNSSGQSQLVRDFDEFEQEQALQLLENHALTRLLHIKQSEGKKRNDRNPV